MFGNKKRIHVEETFLGGKLKDSVKRKIRDAVDRGKKIELVGNVSVFGQLKNQEVYAEAALYEQQYRASKQEENLGDVSEGFIERSREHYRSLRELYEMSEAENARLREENARLQEIIASLGGEPLSPQPPPIPGSDDDRYGVFGPP